MENIILSLLLIKIMTMDEMKMFIQQSLNTVLDILITKRWR